MIRDFDFDSVSICQLFGFKKKNKRQPHQRHPSVCNWEATSVPLKVASSRSELHSRNNEKGLLNILHENHSSVASNVRSVRFVMLTLSTANHTPHTRSLSEQS